MKVKDLIELLEDADNPEAEVLMTMITATNAGGRIASPYSFALMTTPIR